MTEVTAPSRLKRRPNQHKTTYTAKLVDEVAEFLDERIYQPAKVDPVGGVARRLVQFFTARYPHPARVKVACELCGTDTQLLDIHRRDVGDMEFRPGSSDCDVNTLRPSPEFLFLCGPCTEKLDAKRASNDTART